MIFSYEDLCIFDGEPQTIGGELMNVLRSFINEMPQNYINMFLFFLNKDLKNPKSYLYAPIEDVDKEVYWFDRLFCELANEEDADKPDFSDNIKKYEWVVGLNVDEEETEESSAEH